MDPYLFSESAFYKLLAHSANGQTSLKLLDVVLLQEGQPTLWLFTDTQGNLGRKPLTTMLIDDLIKAIICNIECFDRAIEHQDILKMLEKHGNQLICFGLTKKAGRIPLNISQLVNIKHELIHSLEGIQLYKVSTRTFEPFVYYYDVQCQDRKGENYQGFLGKAPLSHPSSLSDELDSSIRSMAEEATRTVLDILSADNKRVVNYLTLIFVMEQGKNPQLWLLGASRLSFIVKGKALLKGKRVSIRNNPTHGVFMLIPRKSADNHTPAPPVVNTEKNILPTEETEKPRSRSVLNKHLAKIQPQRPHNRNRVNIQMLIKSYKDTLENKVFQIKAGENVKQPILKQKGLAKTPATRTHDALFGRKATDFLSKSYEKSKGAIRHTFSKNKENDKEEPLQKAIEVMPVQFVNIERKKEAIKSILQKRDPKLYEKERSRCTPTCPTSQTSSFVKTRLKMKYCAGDFCKSSKHQSPESTLYHAMDELLVYLGRTKMFSPQYNFQIKRIPSYSGNATRSSPTPFLLRNKDLYEEFDESDTEEDLIKFQVEVKGTIEDNFLGTLLSRIREKAQSNPSSIEKLPAYASRLIRKQSMRTVEVCGSCKAMYTKIAKYLGKLVLGEIY